MIQYMRESVFLFGRNGGSADYAKVLLTLRYIFSILELGKNWNGTWHIAGWGRGAFLLPWALVCAAAAGSGQLRALYPEAEEKAARK